jgi:hypothetical protein
MERGKYERKENKVSKDIYISYTRAHNIYKIEELRWVKKSLYAREREKQREEG